MTVADALRARGTGGLADLLRLRPDLCRLRTPTLDELVRHAATDHSTRRVIATLNAWQRQVLEAIVLLQGSGKDKRPVTAEQILRAGEGAELADVLQALDDLDVRLLITVSGAGKKRSYTTHGPVAFALPLPGGLGQPWQHAFERLRLYDLTEIAQGWGVKPERSIAAALATIGAFLRDPENADRILDAALTREERAAFAAAAAADPMLAMPGLDPFTGNPPKDPLHAKLIVHGFVVPVAWGWSEIPREIGLALRRGSRTPYEPKAPAWRGKAPQPDRLHASASDAAMALLADVELVGEAFEQPVKVLSSGGIGVQELRRIAKATGLPERRVRLGITLLDFAKLAHADLRKAALTHAWDTWLAAAPEARWAALAEGWLNAHDLPVARPGSTRKQTPPLPWGVYPKLDVRRLRRGLLDALATSTTADADDRAVRSVLDWHLPPARRLENSGSERALRDDAVPDLLAEMRDLGLLVGSALTPLGAGLREGTTTEAARALLAGGADTAIAQADLTIVCTGRPSRELRTDLDLLADAESRGGASTWRVSEQSLRRAFDVGWDVVQIRDALHRWLRNGLPQPLDYLIDDAGRRYGRLRVRSVSSVIHVDDPALLADVLNHKKVAAAALTRLTDTVAVSPEPAMSVIDVLRAAGFTPATETATGAVRVSRAGKPKRVKVPEPAVWHEPLPAYDPDELAARLLA